MNPRSLTSPLKTLGFKKSISKKVEGKTKRCIPIEQIHINKLLKRYGFESYEVTVDTVVTVTDKILINKEEQEVLGVGGANRMHRNDRNSVTNIQQYPTKSEQSKFNKVENE